MSNKQTADRAYTLGQGLEGSQRLLKMDQVLNPLTQRLLEDAGITKGMKVLDVGCGPGNVSLLVAKLVGKDGNVIGVDNNATALQTAQARAQAAGLRQVSFIAGDLRNLTLTEEFDAIVGRAILQHLPEPASLLSRLVTHLHPGGVVAFQEFDLSSQSDATLPTSSLWGQVTTWGRDACQRAGVELRMGMKLCSTFREAGLPAAHLRYEAAIGTGPEWAGYEVTADIVRVLVPLIVQFGIATPEEIGIETLAERLREELVTQGGIARLPALVSAWTHI